MRPSPQQLIRRATLRLDAQRWPHPGPSPQAETVISPLTAAEQMTSGQQISCSLGHNTPLLGSSLLGVKQHWLEGLRKYRIKENDTICIPKRMLKLESYNTCIVQDNHSDSEDVLMQVPTEPISKINQTLQGARIKELDIYHPAVEVLPLHLSNCCLSCLSIHNMWDLSNQEVEVMCADDSLV